MKRVLVAFAVAIALIASTNNVKAQSPDGQFGLGVIAGSSYGAYLAYALTPAWHIGSGVGFMVGDVTQFSITPYAKFIMSGTKELKPIILGQFNITTHEGVNETTITTMLAFGGGAEYFITENFGLAGTITVLALGFSDPGSTQFGLMNGNIMAEWFF